MNLQTAIETFWSLFFRPIRGSDHQQRLESFYSSQAAFYDASRQHMLRGRAELYRALPLRPGGVWLDMGGGSGASLEYVGDRLAQMRQIYIVDLSRSLLEIARRRIASNGWANVSAVLSDMNGFEPAEGKADAATFSYSLTMTQDWFKAIDRAEMLLASGGVIGAVDYYVSRKQPAAGLRRHSFWTRMFWPAWFGLRNVHPSPDHLPYLMDRFETLSLQEMKCAVPFMPGARIPCYLFIGCKRQSSRRAASCAR